MKRHARLPWLPEEDRIVDRYARDLAAGRQPNLARAAGPCQRDISRLYASLRKSGRAHLVAAHPRTFISIRRRLRLRLGVLGLAWTCRNVSSAEKHVIERHAAALARGKYRNAQEAAVACKSAIERLPKGSTPPQGRSLRAIQSQIYSRALRSGRAWAHQKWLHADDAIVRRYALAVISGKYPSAASALPACCRELAAGPRPGRQQSSVHKRLLETMRKLGLSRHPRWRDDEERIFRRHLRLLFAGRYKYLRDAADACAASLQRLGGSSRSALTVYSRMAPLARELNLPRYKCEHTPAERRLFEKYARAVADGRFPNCKDAAPACRRELVRMYARVGKQSSLRVGRLAGRTLVTINRSICETAGRLGLQFPGRNWLPAEERIFDGWLRWYNRYHDVRRLRPLSQAGEGLSDDLAKQGFRRTPDACRVRLVVTRRRRLGL